MFIKTFFKRHESKLWCKSVVVGDYQLFHYYYNGMREDDFD